MNVTIIDKQTGEEKSMDPRLAKVLLTVKPGRYAERSARAQEASDAPAQDAKATGKAGKGYKRRDMKAQD